MDQRVKAMLGDFAFTIAALQFQNEQLQNEVDALKRQIEVAKKDEKSG